MGQTLRALTVGWTAVGLFLVLYAGNAWACSPSVSLGPTRPFPGDESVPLDANLFISGGTQFLQIYGANQRFSISIGADTVDLGEPLVLGGDLMIVLPPGVPLADARFRWSATGAEGPIEVLSIAFKYGENFAMQPALRDLVEIDYHYNPPQRLQCAQPGFYVSAAVDDPENDPGVVGLLLYERSAGSEAFLVGARLDLLEREPGRLEVTGFAGSEEAERYYRVTVLDVAGREYETGSEVHLKLSMGCACVGSSQPPRWLDLAMVFAALLLWVASGRRRCTGADRMRSVPARFDLKTSSRISVGILRPLARA